MQGYENMILMHLSVFSPRAGVIQGDLTANKFTAHGIREPNPWGGEITIGLLHLGISLSNYNQFDDQSKGF